MKRRKTKLTRAHGAGKPADRIVLTPHGLHLASQCRRRCPVFDWAPRLRRRTG